MRKIQVKKPGGYNQLKIIECIDLEIEKEDEVIVGVKSIGVNYADCIIRMGLYQSAKDYVGYPITPGFETSGVILKKGSSVTEFQVGQEVIALSRFNGYGTQVKVPKSQLFNKPQFMSFQEAAGFPTNFLTAWYALIQLGQVQRGQSVLVHSAAGGVGGALVQIAQLKGAKVTAVVGASHKIEYLKELKVTNIIDKSKDMLWEKAEKISPNGFDLILDANGVSTLKESYNHLAPIGRLIIYGFHSMLPQKGSMNWLKLGINYLKTPRFNPIEMTNENKSVMAFNLSYLFDQKTVLKQAMSELLNWFNSEQLKLQKTNEFLFNDVVKAHQFIESGQSVGKLVLTL